LRFPQETVITAIRKALEAEGVPPVIALAEAELAVDADLQGVPSHGVTRVPVLIKGLREGRAKASPEVLLIRDKAAICVLDGDQGPGRYTSQQAMAEAIRRAQTYGIGACLAVRTSHWGRAHAYAAQAARQGLIGICMTNAVTSMAGWGASGRVIGNNPLAIAVPGVAPDQPIVLDMAMSQAAVGSTPRGYLPTMPRPFSRVPSFPWGTTKGPGWPS